jgi:hypothetical protein
MLRNMTHGTTNHSKLFAASTLQLLEDLLKCTTQPALDFTRKLTSVMEVEASIGMLLASIYITAWSMVAGELEMITPQSAPAYFLGRSSMLSALIRLLTGVIGPFSTHSGTVEIHQCSLPRLQQIFIVVVMGGSVRLTVRMWMPALRASPTASLGLTLTEEIKELYVVSPQMALATVNGYLALRFVGRLLTGIVRIPLCQWCPMVQKPSRTVHTIVVVFGMVQRRHPAQKLCAELLAMRVAPTYLQVVTCVTQVTHML